VDLEDVAGPYPTRVSIQLGQLDFELQRRNFEFQRRDVLGKFRLGFAEPSLPVSVSTLFVWFTKAGSVALEAGFTAMILLFALVALRRFFELEAG